MSAQDTHHSHTELQAGSTRGCNPSGSPPATQWEESPSGRLHGGVHFSTSHTPVLEKRNSQSNGVLMIPHATMGPQVLSVIEISCRSKHFYVSFRSKNRNEVQV